MGSTQFGLVITLNALVLLLFAFLVLLDVRDHLVQVGHLLGRCLRGEDSQLETGGWNLKRLDHNERQRIAIEFLEVQMIRCN